MGSSPEYPGYSFPIQDWNQEEDSPVGSTLLSNTVSPYLGEPLPFDGTVLALPGGDRNLPRLGIGPTSNRIAPFGGYGGEFASEAWQYSDSGVDPQFLHPLNVPASYDFWGDNVLEHMGDVSLRDHPYPTTISLPEPHPTSGALQPRQAQPSMMSESTISAASRPANPSPPPGKRPRGASTDNDVGDAKQQSHKLRKVATEKEPNLACPFYKHGPLDYSCCLKYRLSRIKDVKQHIYRHHSKPRFQCPRCFKTFKTLGAKDSHLLAAECSQSQDPGPKGISESQHTQLSQNFGRFPGEPVKKQWSRIWEVLFPGSEPPQSCYVASDAKELGVQLRVFWNRNRVDILSKLSAIKFEDQAGLADSLMEETFKQFEQEGSDSDTETEKEGEEEMYPNPAAESKSKLKSEDALVEQKKAAPASIASSTTTEDLSLSNPSLFEEGFGSGIWDGGGLSTDLNQLMSPWMSPFFGKNGDGLPPTSGS